MIAWGRADLGPTNVPPGLSNVVKIAAGGWSSRAILSDNTIVGWGNSWATPPGLTNIRTLDVTYNYSQALLSNGLVVAWDGSGIIATPPGLSNCISESTGGFHSLAVLSNRTVVAWGDNTYGQINIPTNLNNVIKVAGAEYHSLALRANGTVVAWGWNGYGQCAVPPGLSNVIAIDGGYAQSVALKSAGTVVAWGGLGLDGAVPPGLSNVIAIACGLEHNIALRQDGTVVAWGDNTYGQTNVPAGLSHVTAVAAGVGHNLVLVGSGATTGAPPSIVTQPHDQTVPAGTNATFTVLATGDGVLTYQWWFNGSPMAGRTTTTLTLVNVQSTNSGDYSVSVSNAFGAVLSSSAHLTVVVATSAPPVIVSQPQSRTVPAGTNVTFTVGANGSSPLLYQWMFNGANVAGGTRSALTRTNVQITDAGSYSVLVSNAFGVAFSSNAMLTVISPPPTNVAFAYGTFSNATCLNLQSNASIFGSVLRITPSAEGQLGTAWHCQQVPLANGFVSDFSFQITDIGCWSGLPQCGGDGFGFIIQNVGPTAFTPEVALEQGLDTNNICVTFNTFWNWPGQYYPEPSDNFVGLLINQNWITTTDLNPLNINMSDGAVHTAHVTFDGAMLAVSVDGVLVLSNALGSAISTAVDSSGSGWVGFGGRTGAAWENHDILSWSLTTGASSNSCVAPPNNLVSWWPGQGNTLDATGGNIGAVAGSGTVTYVSGEVGQSFLFDGTHRDRVDVGNPANLQLQDFSIEAWVKRSDASVSSFDILGADGSVSGEGAIVFGYGRTGYGFGMLNNGQLLLSRIDLDGVYSSNVVADISWHHVAVTKSGTSVVFYIDGMPEVVTSAYVTTFTFDTSAAIGSRGDARGGTFYGAIDEPSVYSRALTGSEISWIYFAGSKGKCRAPVAPIITSQPVNQAVYLTDPVTFYVSATGDAPLAYQWQFFGSSIVGATNSSYSIDSAQSNNAGSYSVIVSNFAGAALSSNAVLTVLPPPGCTPAPAGMVSWWQAQSNANDSADGNNGTFAGDTTLGRGRVGQGFVLDGNGDAVVVGDPANLHLQDFTIEAWVKRSSPTVASFGTHPDGLIFSYGSLGYGFGLWNDGRLFLTRIDIDNVTIPNAITDTNFHHLAVTKSNSTVVFYIDGVGFPAADYANSFTFGTPAAIGARADTMDDSFYGSIDELAVYSRALGAGEIAAIYNAANSGKCRLPIAPFIIVQPTNKTIYASSNAAFSVVAGGDAPLSYQWLFEGNPLAGKTFSTLSLVNVQSSNAGNYSVSVSNVAGFVVSSNALLTVNPLPNCAPAPSGLVSWWRGETNLADSFGPNDGSQPNNGATISYGTGKVGRCFNLNSTCVLIPDSPSLRVTNALTIEAWVNPTSLGGTRAIFTKFESPGLALQLQTNNSYYLGTTNNGQPFFMVSRTGTISNMTSVRSAQALPLNQWSFLVATYDGSALRLYTNGILAAQTNYSAGIFPGADSAAIGARAGLPGLGFALGDQFSGLIDEVSLYNRAVSDAEVLSVYNSDVIGKCPLPPLITVQPQSQSIPLGEDVMFTVGASGSKPLAYQWRFKGTNIFAATNSSVVLEKLQTNQSGDYSVIVSNLVGTIGSSNATLTLTPPPTCVQSPSNAISWWPANGYLNDIVGTNNISVLVPPSPLYATGKVGLAFNHDGFQSRLQVASSPSLNFGSNADFSIEGWIKAISPFLPPIRGTTNPLVPLIEKRSVIGNSGIGYSLLLNQGRLAFGLSSFLGSNSFPMFISTGPDLRDAMFHHVSVTVRRSDTNGGKLYLDGQELLTFNPTSQRGSLSNSSLLFIGSPTTTVSNSTFRGLIDEMTIYNRALSASEILSIRQAGAAGKCLPPPTILAQPTNLLLNAGLTANFRVVASGVPTLAYQWQKNGTNILGRTTTILTLPGVTTGDGGAYNVIVSSPAGSTTSAVATLTVNQPPLASNLTAGTKANTPLIIAIDKLLMSATDPDGDPLSLASVSATSTNGGLVVRGTNEVTYTPLAGYVGSDQFTYTVADGRGGSASAFVLIQVRSGDSSSANMFPPSPVTGGFIVSFAGVPGLTYSLQRADNPSGPWSNIASVTVGPDGTGTYTDTNAPPVSAYYRTTYP